MEFKQDKDRVVEKIEGWVIGGVSIVSSGASVFFWWFFKSLYKRIGAVEKDVARVASKSELAVAKLDARLSGVVEVIEVQSVQNSTEHGHLAESMKNGMDSLGKSIDVLRVGQEQIIAHMLDEKSK